MGKCDKLLARAKNSPKGLRFEELCQLAECYGFVFARQRGSHKTYKNPRHQRILTFQSHDGMAVPAQIRELLEAIEELEDSQ